MYGSVQCAKRTYPVISASCALLVAREYVKNRGVPRDGHSRGRPLRNIVCAVSYRPSPLCRLASDSARSMERLGSTAMKDPSEFTRPAGAGTGAQHLNGHATNTALAGTLSDADSAGIFRRDITGLAGRRPRWPPGGWQHHPDRPEPGTENRHNDEFLAVFAEELRSSLAAISTATEILRAEAS